MPRKKFFADDDVMKLFKRIKNNSLIDGDGAMLLEYFEQLDAETCHSLKTCDPSANEYYKGCAAIVDKLIDNFAKCTERKKKTPQDVQTAHI